MSLITTDSESLGASDNKKDIFEYAANRETFTAWGYREVIKYFPEWLTAKLSLAD